jgi:DNA-binding beta-propeller fold protein YncE
MLRRPVWLALATALAAAPAARAQVYVSADNNTVGKYDASTGSGSQSFIGVGSQPSGVAVDTANHLFVAVQSGLPRVAEFNATTGAVINNSFITSVTFPVGVAVSGTNLFVADSNQVRKFDTTTAAAVPGFSLTGLTFPAEGVALDAANVYVANGTRVGKYDATTGTAVNANLIPIPGGFSPFGLAVDVPNNHLFVSTNENRVREYDLNGNLLNATFISTGLSTPVGLALDFSGHLFVVNNSTGLVGEYNATSGALINSAFINTGAGSGPEFVAFAPLAVPEPSSLAMIGVAAFGAAVRLRRRRSAAD